MVYAFPSAGALDYANCSYGRSRLLFRGPKRDTEGAFIAVLGGSECYGRCVKHPFADLIEKDLGLPVANFGLQNAGPDAFLNDPLLMGKIGQAAVTVVQLFGVQNISNRFYTVHPRRNDRFLSAKPALKDLFPKTDFTDFHFTRHLLQSLQQTSPQHFAVVVEGLQQDWLHHMRVLLNQINGQTLLLWIADAMPPPRHAAIDLVFNPMLIDAEMIGQLSPKSGHIVYAVPSPEARAMGLEGMVYDPTELPVAAALPGPSVHREICNAVLPHLEQMLSVRQARVLGA
ncbi:MAG: DUF6473 family protein [Cypionkella sp.]|nr:DUF6473 family protein [Cypionkella sp.]